jgi:hypothetical protein
LNGITRGTYLEIGCNDPITINNTYLLEKVFDWNGFSIDIVPEYVDRFRKVRNNPVDLKDALLIDWKFEPNTIIDYLSIDTDPPTITLAALKHLRIDHQPGVAPRPQPAAFHA